ncbi:hypothetical protein CLV29_0580 [Naumannella halotolerans]|uniref:Uncharacterized protein n=1 Tax=Naumannella halotolerans TaxID=993414 RepID=A0A4R7J9D9_9ACTN|nr:hypothetical protein CLV29_0580 [Naumannella halotolerans]
MMVRKHDAAAAASGGRRVETRGAALLVSAVGG